MRKNPEGASFVFIVVYSAVFIGQLIIKLGWSIGFMAYTRTKREEVAKITKKDRYFMSGWQKSFSASKLPKGQVKINAWAFDTNTGKAFKLNGTHILQSQ